MNPYRSEEVSSKTRFKVTKLIHLALVAGPAPFAIMAFSIKKSTIITIDFNNPLFIVCPLMMVACLIAGNFIYKQQIPKAAGGQTLASKLLAYQTTMIIRSALLESPALFNIVCYFLTGNFIFLIIGTALLIYLFMLRPTIDSLETELGLTYEDKLELGE